MGTRFEIIIPNLEQVEKTNKPVSEKPTGNDEIQASGIRVLIVDDSELNRKLLSVMLREYQYITFEAEDGSEALDILSKEKPELILMDIYMPNMDGYSALKMLKDNKITAAIPVIAVTASASEEEKENVFAAGFDAYITKPVNKELLLQEIRKFTKRNTIVNS